MTETHATTLGRSLCLGGASLGAIVLVGWFAGTGFLVTAVPRLPPMAPDAAFALLLLGIAGALLNSTQPASTWRLFSKLIGAVVIAIGVEMAVMYALGIRPPLVHFLHRYQAMPYPWRRSPPTAVALVLLGAAILLFDMRPDKRIRPSEWLILCASLIAVTALLGYLYGANAQYRVSGSPIAGLSIPTTAVRTLKFSGQGLILGVAVPGALGALMICVGLLLGWPRAGITRVFTAAGPGGALLTRVAPVAILILVVLGFVAAWFPDNEEVPLTFAALTAITILASLFLLGITAAHLERTHDKLEQARARNRELVEQASDGIFLADLDGRLIDVNDAALRLCGDSREEALKKSIPDLIPPEDAARYLSSKTQLIEGGTHLAEWMLRHKDGSYRPVEVSGKMLPDGRWEGIVRDISERKRAEEALRISEAKFSGMVSSSADAIISIDEAQRITLFNTGAEKIFGYSSAETIGAPLGLLIPERFREIHARHVKSFLAGPDCARQAHGRQTIYGLRRNGEEFPADAAISKISVGGNSILSVTLRDITESRRLYQTAIQATRARDEVLGIVAHDLRNPLQIITINADSLRRSGPEPVREMAAEIRDAAYRMNHLIRDLLDVTSIEDGHLSFKPERLSAAEIVSESLDAQTPLTASASLDLQVTIAPNLSDIWADHDRLLQVFENLIGNAIKFTKAGGRIVLRAEARTGEVVFSVSDTGSGIADRNLPHVFNRFWQASNGSHRGAGLGLAIVKGIVEAHGGRIWVRSSAGQGTTFFFTIPTAPQAGRLPQARSPRVNALAAATN